MSTFPTESSQAIEMIKIRVLPDGRMSRRDAAKYLGLSEKTLAMWALENKGPKAHKVGGRCFYFQASLDDFIAGEAA